jgi:RimJ/RimL family protein N-acetyltransferase
VMADLGGPYDAGASREKFDRYRLAWQLSGVSRWALVDKVGLFLGYAGVMERSDPNHPLGPHYEVGWRLCRRAWGHGLATEAARRGLHHAWSVLNMPEILSYTAADNVRSQSVMGRLGLLRDTSRDFTAPYERGPWSGLVWVVKRPNTVATAL